MERKATTREPRRTGQVAAIAAPHHLHGVLDAGHLVDGGEVAAHDFGDRRPFRIEAFEDDSPHEVAFAEETAEVAAAEDQDCSDV